MFEISLFSISGEIFRTMGHLIFLFFFNSFNLLKRLDNNSSSWKSRKPSVLGEEILTVI